MNNDVILLKMGGKVDTLPPKYFTGNIAKKLPIDTQYILIPVGVYEKQYLVFEPHTLIQSFVSASISYKMTVVGNEVDMMCQIPSKQSNRHFNVSCSNLVEIYQFVHSVVKLSTFNILYNGLLGKRYCGYNVYALIYDIELEISLKNGSIKKVDSFDKKGNLTPGEAFLKNFSKDIHRDVLPYIYSSSVHGTSSMFKCVFNLKDHTWTESKKMKNDKNVLVAVNLNLYNTITFVYGDDMLLLEKVIKDKSIIGSIEIIQYSVMPHDTDENSTTDILDQAAYFPLMHQSSYMMVTASDYIQMLVMLYHNFTIIDMIKDLLDESAEYDYNRIGILLRRDDLPLIDFYIDSGSNTHDSNLRDKFIKEIREKQIV